ncbi:lasso peptide biosynthesis B2 protein [Longibacter sp.]|jgi:hypothetical protein|uniref:lasso peptide biosynthesis B2 protein n=1 Tax=Longibacter sp. TaxID=2045415 RepID=UPI003EB893BB
MINAARTLPGRIRRVFQRFRALPVAERRILCMAVPTVITVAVLLRVAPYRYVVGLLDRVCGTKTNGSDAQNATPDLSPEERRILWAVHTASRRVVPKRPCLTQALAARCLFARGGQPIPSIHFGVERHRGRVAAHAWLERGGTVILGGAHAPSRYTRLDAQPARSHPSPNR